MSENQLRPRFTITTVEKREVLIERLKKKLSKDRNQIHGVALDTHATIKLPEEEIIFWSPQLDLDFREVGKTIEITGLFGPKPSLWLLFMFSYLVCGFVTLFGLTIGFSELSMDKPLYGFYVIPICIVIAISLYLAAKFGQKKCQHQTNKLYEFVIEALELNQTS